MKLDLALLERVVDLPTHDPQELRTLFDEIGLEVKDIDLTSGRAIFTIETLANRGDQLYALGIAREIAARTLARVKLPSVAQNLSDRKPSLSARIESDLCRRYALLEMTLPSSMTLRSDVAQIVYPNSDTSASRPAIVDLLNFVQKELGTPMHAFDRDKIEGDIVVEAAREEVEIDALDGKRYRVPQGTILICDRKKILAAGGVIGCANSMVTSSTERALIEAAWFDPIQIRKSARRMGVSTDASYAFERGTDLEMLPFALRRLVYLCCDASGSAAAHVVGYSALGADKEQQRLITLSHAMLRRELNSPRLASAEVSARLKQLGFSLSERQVEKDTLFEVIVPSWRIFDVFYPEDLLEEFSRAHGLSQVRLELPQLDYEVPALNPIEITTDQLEVALLGNGFYEVITRNFLSATEVDVLSKFGAATILQHVALQNSLETSNAFLKSTNILSLARVAQDNLRKGVSSVKVFEYGRLYSSQGDQELERDVLSLAMAGRWFEGEFRSSESLQDRVRLFRGVIDAIFASLGVTPQFSDEALALLHPGCRVALKVGRTLCGSFGLIDPRLERALDLQTELLYAEFDLQALSAIAKHGEYAEVSDLPAVKRDITLRHGMRESAAKVAARVEGLSSEMVEAVHVIDDFHKDDEDFRRLTLRLVYRSKDRTLQGHEVDADLKLLLQALEQKFQIGQVL